MMAEIYGKETGICKGYGGSMHFVDVGRGFLGTSGIVGQGIPRRRRRVGIADPREGPGGAFVLRRRASKQGRLPRDAQHRLPLEAAGRIRDGEQQLPGLHEGRARGRERRAGEPLAVKAKAYSMPGVTVDGGDPVAVHDVVHAAVERARGATGRRSWSRSSTA